MSWAKTRPEAFSEKTGKPDSRGAFGLLAREVITGIMLRAGTITKNMHDAARDFQAQFTIACYDTSSACAFGAIRRGAIAPS
jgi:hypothetical protein